MRGIKTRNTKLVQYFGGKTSVIKDPGNGKVTVTKKWRRNWVRGFVLE